MPRPFLTLALPLAVLLSGLTPLALAADPSNAHATQTTHPAHTHPATADAWAEGVVKKLDATQGTVTLSHGPLPNGMPAMTMAFRVQDPAWLTQLKVGQRIRFGINDQGDTLTRYQSAP